MPPDTIQVVSPPPPATVEVFTGGPPGPIGPAGPQGPPGAPGATSFTVIDAAGDLIVGASNDTPQRLPVGTNGRVLSVTAGMPAWTPAPSGVEWDAAYNPATAYLPGDVVTYQGITYMAVNPSTGSTPPTADPGIPSAQKGVAGGVATLDANGHLPGTQRTSYGATPPASPQDGDLWMFPADATNGVMWQFRYNAGSGSAYKWEFIGGSPLHVFVSAEVASNVGSYSDDAASRLTVPRTGDYLLRVSCEVRHTASGQITDVVIRNTAGVFTLFGQVAANAGPTDLRMGIGAEMLLAGAGATGYVNIGGQVGGGSAYMGFRTVALTPRRVS